MKLRVKESAKLRTSQACQYLEEIAWVLGGHRGGETTGAGEELALVWVGAFFNVFYCNRKQKKSTARLCKNKVGNSFIILTS